MRQGSGAAQSGWGWGGGGPPSNAVPPPRPPVKRGRTGAELALAIAVFLLILGGVGAAVLLRARSNDDDEAPMAETPEVAEVPSPAPAEPAEVPKRALTPRSLETIRWTTETAATLDELARIWTIPTETLVALNPELSVEQALEAGTKVVVYSHTQGPSASIGPPNDGKLVGGMPLPEGKAWSMPDDRGRAFATTETIAAIVAGFEAYGRAFPEAAPIQVGDLSARRGGSISGHQSHQTGRDVDIRLVLAEAGEGFDGARTWFLVKTLIDGAGGARDLPQPQ